MAESHTVHVRLWDRGDPSFAGEFGFGCGLFLNAYETLEPPYYRQTLYLTEHTEIHTTDAVTELGCVDNGKWCCHMKIDNAERTALVFHNAYRLFVVYEEALQVIKDLKSRGY